VLRDHPLFKAYLALALVCFFWGTTYLGIRMALESFPPVVLVSSRFLISGSILLAAAKARGMPTPGGRELAVASASGTVALGVGNGCLVWAETHVPSGIAGLITTVAPFWLVGIEALMPQGERLHLPALAGMLVGLGGAALLLAPDVETGAFNPEMLAGFLILQMGSLAWTTGSLFQRRQKIKAHPVVTGAVQQVAAGLAFLLPAVFAPHAPVQWSARGAGALLYLVTFGSIVGYSAYVYALDRLPVSVVSIYPYVNAVVAVTLGWVFYREPFGTRQAAAMAIIFVGVWLVKRFSPSARS
jgi:drug/metabolite transporter (DMT)-like permease